MEYNRELFGELPQAMVKDMIGYSEESGNRLLDSFEEILNSRGRIRDQIMIKNDSTIIDIRKNPTTCGIDGAYAIDRLLATAITATTAVAVEGLTPPTERRYWPEPHHRCSVVTTNHHDAIPLILRCLMLSMELELAYEAPHDVVLLDGSLTTPLIHINQALGRLSDSPQELSHIISNRIKDMLVRYEEVLASRGNKIYAGIPKYTSRRDIAESIGLKGHEDRSLLTLILDAHELVGPINLVKEGENWHFANLPKEFYDIAYRIVEGIKRLKVIYYRPSPYLPTLRAEVSPAVAENKSRLALLLESLQLQSAPGIIEPYPLYIADRMVKHLSSGLYAIRESITNKILSNTRGEYANLFLLMQEYRSKYIE